MTAEELAQWRTDALKLDGWERSVFRRDSASYEPALLAEKTEECFACPLCHGEGEVDGQRYDAKAVLPATLVGYGIGEGLEVAERWAEESVGAVLALTDTLAAEREKVRALEAEATDYRNVLEQIATVPHRCIFCGWDVGGVPKGLHNTGCLFANTLDKYLDARMQ